MEKAMKRSSIKNDGMFEWINPEELQNAIEAHRKISPEKYK